ncbi:MAG: NADH-dependent flavin oxidoreductase, partial [Bacteroidales bacterium]|nr:NADH-dependent flavin oxidoreductase [Bacteroidales bacterium]
VSDDEIAYYRHRNQSAGLLITACAYIMPQGKGFHGQIGAHSDEMIPSLRRIAEALKENGGKAVLQIYHGGRMSSIDELPDRQCVSASAVASLRPGAQIPREMTPKEIEETIEAYGEACRRAIEAGFDGVEIHGANTYLIQQFFSPHSNRRTDKWGGSLTKRMAFPLAVTDAVIKSIEKHATRPFLAGYRISPEEVENPGISIEDTLELVEVLSQKKLDYLHISTQDIWGASIRDSQDKEPRTQMILNKLGNSIPIIGVGGIRTPEQAEKAMETGISLVAIGRELLIEPHWQLKIKQGIPDKIETELDLSKQAELKIPTPMWNSFLSRTGWIPLKNQVKQF